MRTFVHPVAIAAAAAALAATGAAPVLGAVTLVSQTRTISGTARFNADGNSDTRSAPNAGPWTDSLTVGNPAFPVGNGTSRAEASQTSSVGGSGGDVFSGSLRASSFSARVAYTAEASSVYHVVFDIVGGPAGYTFTPTSSAPTSTGMLSAVLQGPGGGGPTVFSGNRTLFGSSLNPTSGTLLPGRYTFEVSAITSLRTDDFSGSNASVNFTLTVPAPSTACAALGGLAALRRRRRAAF